MDAILFSAKVNVDDAKKHLDEGHEKLYWATTFRILKDKFLFPIQGFIHQKGKQVEYEATIVDIIPYNPAHYEDPALSEKVKPARWRITGEKNLNNAIDTLVITKIERFSIETTSLRKYDGTPVKKAPQGNYTRIRPPRA